MVPLPSLTDDIAAVQTALDALPTEARLNWMHGLGKREMASLWERGGPVAPEHFAAGEGEVVVHEGQNSLLPGFDRFAKHFVRIGDTIQGINVQFWSFVTGPGHFVVRMDGSELVFDYTRLPAGVPSGWPALVPNDQGLSRLVYGGMIDRMRQVSREIVVGKAFRNGKDEGAYFMLHRV
jgi:hypothetical protein